MNQIVIIGNGISGITAARNIRKRSDHRITVVSSETDYFYSRTALMYIYMGNMKFEHTKPYEDGFWKKNSIELLRDHVEKIETEKKSLLLQSGKKITYDSLILATGSTSNKFGWPGHDLAGVQSLYGYPDLQQLEINTKGILQAVIVGGGLIGVELAEMLRSREIDVTFLIREPEFWSVVLPLQEANLVSRHIRSHQVNLLLNAELKEIQSGLNGRVCSVTTTPGETIPCQFVGLTVGVSPNIRLLKGSGIETHRGVLVDPFLQTNVPDVYAIGDCVERNYALPGRKNIEQVWYTGRMMGEVVAQTICGDKTPYEPGPWFNSAKFFNIEYQTYGNVNNTLQPNEAEFYWEHKSGTRCVHLVWDNSSQVFLGINVFGIRMRHECFDRWLRERKSIRFVVANLAMANFDPEFFTHYEDEIAEAFAFANPGLALDKLNIPTL